MVARFFMRDRKMSNSTLNFLYLSFIDNNFFFVKEHVNNTKSVSGKKAIYYMNGMRVLTVIDGEKSCERPVATGWLQTICFVEISH